MIQDVMENDSELFSKRLLSLRDVMSLTRMGRTYLYQLEKSNQLVPLRVGRNLRYLESDVMAWIDLQVQNSRQNRDGGKQ